MVAECDDFNLDMMLSRCRKGDQRAWTELTRRYERLVRAICRKAGIPESHCADIIQETFIALFRNIDSVRAAAALPKWLSVTATRLAIRHRQAARATMPLDDIGDIPAPQAEEAFAKAEEAEYGEAVTLALESMPAETSNLLHMLFVEDLPYHEISARTGRPIGSIGPTRQRGLTRLRKAVLAGQAA